MNKKTLLTAFFLLMGWIPSAMALTLSKIEYSKEKRTFLAWLSYLDTSESVSEAKPKVLRLLIEKHEKHIELKLHFKGSIEENQEQVMRHFFDALAETFSVPKQEPEISYLSLTLIRVMEFNWTASLPSSQLKPGLDSVLDLLGLNSAEKEDFFSHALPLEMAQHKS